MSDSSSDMEASGLQQQSSVTSSLNSMGKARKKRPRPSKRAHTTILSTDTMNFKAMVQHFTGLPCTNNFNTRSDSFQPHGYSRLSMMNGDNYTSQSHHFNGHHDLNRVSGPVPGKNINYGHLHNEYSSFYGQRREFGKIPSYEFSQHKGWNIDREGEELQTSEIVT